MSVEVPPVFVTLRVTVKVPLVAYVCEMVGEVVVCVCPSPKSHAYVAILPTGDEEADASRVTVAPLVVGVNLAVGAWSGVIPDQRSRLFWSELRSKVMEDPVVKSIKATTWPDSFESGIHPVLPSGVIDKKKGLWISDGIGYWVTNAWVLVSTFVRYQWLLTN
jgi:hypothetical protein